MSQQTINVGTADNNGTGDPARTGGQKINANFTEVYGALGATGSPLALPSALPVSKGGSGAVTLTGYVKGNGTSAMTAVSAIPYSDVSGTPSNSVSNGFTGLTSVTAGQIPVGNGTSAFNTYAGLTFNGTTLATTGVAVNGATVTSQLDVLKNDNADAAIATFLANNGTAGVQINYSGIYAAGSNGSNDLILSAKGSGALTFISSGAQKFGGGGTYILSNSVNGQFNQNGSQPLYINYYGYNAGLTQPRDLIIADGRGATLAQFLSAGNNVIGKGALATNATDGFLYIPSCAGIPTGTPTAFTGMVPMVYDSTNNNFYIYNGAWKKVGLT